MVRGVVFAAGALLAAWTLLSAVRTVILPRSAQSVLSAAVFRTTRIVFRTLASLRPGFSWKDRVMAMFSPLGMLALVGAWLALTGSAFMVMFWAAEQQGWADAFHKSGSSLFTLGFAPIDGTWLRLLSFVEAALGLGLLALVITYLPTLYLAFSRRETPVALLAARAGTPPAAITLIERMQGPGWQARLDAMWEGWEQWFAEIEESHTSFPALSFFRSPLADRHWVTAAGCVLDAASLMLAASEVHDPRASLVVETGEAALNRIADFFGIRTEPAGDAITIRREEVDEALDVLRSAGLPVREDREMAWVVFKAHRSRYDIALLTLAQLTMAPYAPWSSDRSAPGYREPRVRRWGRRHEQVGS